MREKEKGKKKLTETGEKERNKRNGQREGERKEKDK
jgi:hypothetical protein